MTDKNFYIMLSDPPWAGPTANILSGPDIDVDDGVLIENVQQKYEIELTVDRQADNKEAFPPCDIHDLSMGLMFSHRLIEILNNEGVNNIQYFDADVSYEPTGEKYNYRVANILGSISALDIEKSDVTLSHSGIVIDIEQMVFDEAKMNGNKIFRLKESIMHIVVHKSIKEAIETAGLSGFLFITDDEYEPGML
ncbi:MAG TPA: hypothetical protein ENJ08_00520 [Gammaproteobacteria bacterium]|nr:hypothetical protein [Gammaproteobacteria bacterium]